MRSKIDTVGQPNRSFISEARRGQIMGAAIEVIAEVGFSHASLNRIAERAGVSKGVISYHFAGKDELIREIVSEAYGGAVESSLHHMSGETTAAAKLGAYIRSNVEGLVGHREYVMALMEIFTNMRTPEGKLHDESLEDGSTFSLLANVLENGQSTGEFRKFDVPVVTRAIQSSVDGVAVHWAANPDLDLAVCADELVTLFGLATARTAQDG